MLSLKMAAERKCVEPASLFRLACPRRLPRNEHPVFAVHRLRRLVPAPHQRKLTRYWNGVPENLRRGVDENCLDPGCLSMVSLHRQLDQDLVVDECDRAIASPLQPEERQFGPASTERLERAVAELRVAHTISNSTSQRAHGFPEDCPGELAADIPTRPASRFQRNEAVLWRA